ncbi:tetratricopeptide repeat protein [Saccharicrinis aurantiacus]|uniref:tetratricopeptide repeat protein n=1 Tax=Saccharicrinis aurantiacus TaxID=1849719 RepID=UPI00083909CD|nr:LuxR C-terminal-related transcriptional regulator [Saccharicrinis aurantiacus]
MLYCNILKKIPLIVLIIYPLWNLKANSNEDTQGNSSNSILNIIELANDDLLTGRFNSSFERLSNILPEAIQTKDTVAQILIYRKFGVLYGKFGQNKLSLEHMKKGLTLAKKQKNTKLTISCLHALASQYSEIGEYHTSLQYLDSCLLRSTKQFIPHYIKSLYARNFLRMGEYGKATEYFNDILPELKYTNYNHQVAIINNVAELKLAINQTDSAQYYFEKALDIVNKQQIHPMIKPSLLNNLAQLYYKKGNKNKAYQYMSEANTCSDSIFNILGENNKELFKLKSKYSDDILKKEQTIKEQNLHIEAINKASFRLKLLIAILLVLAIIAFYTVKMRFKMRSMAQTQEHTKKKNEAVLETKNKELAVNALQLIEKEHTIEELLDFVKENDKDKHKSLAHKYEQNSKKLWNDFHDRFTQINNQFYERLLEIAPGLTPTELKHCALIKLNFDSKEMAQILGISQNSVHMSRSRIRKKLNLNREDSLSNYIAGI